MSTGMRTDHAADLSRVAGVMNEKLRQFDSGGPVRLEIGVPDLNLLAWLERQVLPQKVYWSNRDRDLAVAGVGIADSVEPAAARDFGALESLADTGLRYFGGFRFADVSAAETDSPWEAFGPGRFVLPRFEVCRHNGETVLACNLAGGDLAVQIEEALSILAQLNFDIEQKLEPVSGLHGPEHLPEPSGWRRMVGEALESIGHTFLKKVVLARRTSYHSEGALSPWVILAGLEARSHGCYHFAVQPEPGLAFVGASPERLLKKLLAIYLNTPLYLD